MKKILSQIILLSIVLSLYNCSNAENQQPSNNDLTSINIASFNLRMDTEKDGDDAWPNRREMVNGLIRFHDIDIVGTQEGFKHQLDDILRLSDYAYVGVGRDDGKDAGEHSAIVYKKNRFDVIEKGNFWFSETPEVPGKGWDAECCNRICSWAKLKDKDSNKEFYVFNVHYDHQGKEARKNSSILLMQRIKQIAEGQTVMITGDFNAVPDSEPIQLIYNDGRFKDSYKATEQAPYGTLGTTNSFKVDSPMQNRIDYVWVTENVTVNKYGVLNDIQYGHFPSDHFPVMVNVTF
ncbi:MAG: endonuclease/exonuclease/phosphatase family protein [Fermentimonas sp.]|jgi:endonuclease/exonuclease/phosphatase family metal-dependent hydrolase